VAVKKMERKILKVKKEGDSIGGIVEIVVKNPPVGLGEPVFDKLEADLAKALMSIGAIKGFEVGNGFEVAKLRGSQNNDAMYLDKKTKRVRTRTNRVGGIAGGISNGEDIVLRIAVKPASSIKLGQETVTFSGKRARISVKGRHDPCICPRVVPVAESMVALTLFDHLIRLQLLRRKTKLRNLRTSLDLLDNGILFLLAERQAAVKRIGMLKRNSGRKILDLNREKEILRKQLALASELGLDLEITRELLEAIFQLGRSAQKRPIPA
jgi:chorismate mutase